MIVCCTANARKKLSGLKISSEEMKASAVSDMLIYGLWPSTTKNTWMAPNKTIVNATKTVVRKPMLVPT